MFAALALAALVIEALAGYPAWLYRAIGHPVTWIGALIAWAKDAWNHPRLPFALRRLNGALALAMTGVLTAAIALALVYVATLLPWAAGAIFLAVAASTLLAQRSLDEHVAAVAGALETDGLSAGREAVSRIVGRDPDALDEAGVARAAIESLAENFSDGVVAPLFWMVIAGLPGAALYKAVNTGDSMVGHKSERYFAFGWTSARLDDLLNLPASRLAALWIVAAALLQRGSASATAAWQAVLRDARHHRSPNAGWPEAAMAGALGLRLAGPRVYDGARVDDAWMGEGREAATAADIRAALALYRGACALEGAAIALLALMTLAI